MDGPVLDGPRLADLCSAALDVLPRPLVIGDQTKILFANAAAARTLRATSASELIGLSLNEILHPDLHATAALRRQLIAESRHVFSKLPVKLVGRDGSTISAMTDAHPIEVDGDTAIVFIYGPACVVETVS
jgi:PAS domain S-box-containing protein